MTSADSYEGTYCAAVGLTLGQASQLRLDVETSAGKIGFWYKISGGNMYVLIDEGTVGILGSTTGWQYAEYDITEGPHTIDWQFFLFSGPSEADAQIDNVRIFSP